MTKAIGYSETSCGWSFYFEWSGSSMSAHDIQAHFFKVTRMKKDVGQILDRLVKSKLMVGSWRYSALGKHAWRGISVISFEDLWCKMSACYHEEVVLFVQPIGVKMISWIRGVALICWMCGWVERISFVCSWISAARALELSPEIYKQYSAVGIALSLPKELHVCVWNFKGI